MKKVLALLMIVATLMSLAVVSYADTQGNVKKGTPTIDGKLDNIYKDSLDLKPKMTPNGIEPDDNAYKMDTSKMHCYVLWDDSALYFFIIVPDTNLVNTDAVSIFFNNDKNWAASYIPTSDDFQPTGSAAVDATRADPANCLAVGGINAEDGYYFVEMKYVFNAEGSGVLQNNWLVGLHFCVWNAITADGETKAYTSGWNVPDNVKLIPTAATGEGTDDSIHVGEGQPAITTPTATTTAPPPTGTADNNNNNNDNNAQTSDSMIVVSAVALCALAAGIIVSKKKRH